MTLNSSDEAEEEEEMLKRAIAMSLEQEEEGPSSIKGKILRNVNIQQQKMDFDKSLQLFSWHRGRDARHLASF